MTKRPVAALIYDFDKTLSPRDMQEYAFLPGIGMEPAQFWAECRRLQEKNRMDYVLAYMYMMQKMAHGRLPLTRDTLRSLGEKVEFFPGVETWFSRMNAIGEELGIQVEHYIISSGLVEIIEGSRIGNRFQEIFAASFMYDENGMALWPATAVNYTAKTQFLFRINKGIVDVTNDRDLNAYTPDYKRRIPFSNMIYIGDGLTDVPCMKMTKLKGGYSIAVHSPENPGIADDMLVQGRADYALAADYSEGSGMEKVASALLKRISVMSGLMEIHKSQLSDAYARKGVPGILPVRSGSGEEVEY